MSIFYNTTKETDTKEFVQKALKQDDVILELFKSNPFQLFSPFSVWSKLFTEETPITSIRRSITNLEKCGALEKTDIKVPERFGRPNFTWRLRHPTHIIQGQLF